MVALIGVSWFLRRLLAAASRSKHSGDQPAVAYVGNHWVWNRSRSGSGSGSGGGGGIRNGVSRLIYEGSREVVQLVGHVLHMAALDQSVCRELAEPDEQRVLQPGYAMAHRGTDFGGVDALELMGRWQVRVFPAGHYSHLRRANCVQWWRTRPGHPRRRWAWGRGRGPKCRRVLGRSRYHVLLVQSPGIRCNSCTDSTRSAADARFRKRQVECRNGYQPLWPLAGRWARASSYQFADFSTKWCSTCPRSRWATFQPTRPAAGFCIRIFRCRTVRTGPSPFPDTRQYQPDCAIKLFTIFIQCINNICMYIIRTVPEVLN